MHKYTICALLLGACSFPSEGTGESSGSEESSSTGTDPSVTTTATTTTATTSAPTTTTSDPSGGSSSDDGSTTELGTTDESTGEMITDYALAFDGTSHARKIADDGVYDWALDNYTVEMWVRIDDLDATGVIFDGTNASFTSGWVFYLHNDWHALVFSFFDETHYNNVVMGPSVEEIGVGWHHFAATKNGTSVRIHVDGATEVVASVPDVVADDATLWTVGTSTALDASFSLHDVAIDDVRITAYPRYVDNFIPPLEYDDALDYVLLLLRIDEGEGNHLVDEASQIDFTVENPVWVAGNDGG